MRMMRTASPEKYAYKFCYVNDRVIYMSLNNGIAYIGMLLIRFSIAAACIRRGAAIGHNNYFIG